MLETNGRGQGPEGDLTNNGFELETLAPAINLQAINCYGRLQNPLVPAGTKTNQTIFLF